MIAAESGPPGCRASNYQPETRGDYPVVCVEGYAAYAYCTWAGKELCGTPKGGSLSTGDYLSNEQSAWQNACTSGGTLGSAVVGGIASKACTLAGNHGKGHQPVESDPACHSPVAPFDAILNLGGGVVEWESASDNDGFITRGPSAPTPDAAVDEACSAQSRRGGASDDVGFRCCKPL